jgi:hypothetical protein
MKTKTTELAVIVKGEIVTSNFELYAEQTRLDLSEFNTELNTDLEFGQATKDIKTIKDARKAMAEKQDEIFEQLEGINIIAKGIAALDKDMLAKQSYLTKAVKTRKDEIKQDLIDNGVKEINVDCRENYRNDLIITLKGKSSLDSMRKGVESIVKDLNARHITNLTIIEIATTKYGASVAPDKHNLIDREESALRETLDVRGQAIIDQREKDELKKKQEAAEKELAEMKLKEAEKEKQAHTPEPTPDAPEPTQEPKKVSSIPVGNTPKKEEFELSNNLTEEGEFAAYKAKALGIFAELKAFGKTLKYEGNIKRIEKLSNGVNAGWQEMVK